MSSGQPVSPYNRSDMSIQLVVFDLDGTLIDSRRDLADATNALIAELGGKPLSVGAVTEMVGEGAPVLVRRVLTAAGLDPRTPGALDRFLAHYDERLTVHTRPYDGLIDALSALRSEGRALAVLTNKPGRPSREILERLELAPFFSQVIGGDTAAGRKPDPTGLLNIVQRAQVAPAATVMVGDSPVDAETARRAGAVLCIARYGFGAPAGGLVPLPGEMAIDSPSELPQAIRSFRPDSGGVRLPETSQSRT
jgi:phosphoglycolate phosphatase